MLKHDWCFFHCLNSSLVTFQTVTKMPQKADRVVQLKKKKTTLTLSQPEFLIIFINFHGHQKILLNMRYVKRKPANQRTKKNTFYFGFLCSLFSNTYMWVSFIKIFFEKAEKIVFLLKTSSGWDSEQ